MRRALFCLVLYGLMTCACWAQHGWATIDGILLKDCPTEYGEYSAKAVIKDYLLTEVRVYSNGKVLQTIRPKGEDDMLAAPVYAENADQLVHFPDANNDGYRDLFVGPGGSRTQNTLYLWNPETSRFERCPSAGDLQNPVFCPREGAIYDGGSNSAWEFALIRYVWQGSQLVETHTLDVVSDVADYNRHADPQYRKTHAYVLAPKSGRTLKTNSRSELPAKWQKMLKLILD